MSAADPEIVDRQHAAAEAEWLAAWLEGPRRTRWTTLPPQAGDPAPDLELPDTSGATRRLSEFWAQGVIHLAFLRHFGCSCLAERWEGLQADLGRLEAAGARLVAVALGEPERTAAVAARRGYPFAILCDPDRRAYEAYGLLEGQPAQVLHDFPWQPGDRAAFEQHFASRKGTERAVVDNPWQLPGEFVIDRGGRIALAHRYQYCEDFPPTSVLLGAIAAAG